MPDDPSLHYSNWKSAIEKAQNETRYNAWCDEGTKIEKRYRDERDVYVAGRGPEPAKRFNVLWSNTQTLRPAIFARVPEPQVVRNFRDQDPVGRMAAQILERSMMNDMEADDLDDTLKKVVEDYLLPGRGIAVCNYKPDFETKRTQVFRTDDGFAGEDGNAVDRDSVVTEGRGRGTKYFYENNQLEGEWAPIDYFYWKDVVHKDVKTWKDLVRRGWIAFREELTRKELRKKFSPDVAKDIAGAVDKPAVEINPTYEVWMIWDASKRKVMWLSLEYPEMIDEIDDPLNLDGFYPTPRFLLSTTTNDTLIPVPDYHEYISQARQLDEMTNRISLLAQALKMSGVFDNSFPMLQEVMKKENKLVGVDNWAKTGQGGIGDHISFVPLQEIAATLMQLTQAREQVKQDLYEITGIADIIRGQSDPRETMGAQRLKGRFATVRLSDRQREVQRYIRDLYALKGEIMVKHFSAETLIEKSSWLRSPDMHIDPPSNQQEMQAAQQKQLENVQKTQAAIALLKDDEMATFRLDIETDATLALDDEEERQSKIAFVGMLSQFMQTAQQAAKETPAMAPILAQLLLFVVRSWKTGREMEGQIEDALDELKNTPPAQPPPDPAMEEVKRRAQEDQFQHEENTTKNQISAGKLQLDWQKFLHEAGVDDATLDLDAGKLVMDQMKAILDARVKIETAQITQDNKPRTVEIIRGMDGRAAGFTVQ